MSTVQTRDGLLPPSVERALLKLPSPIFVTMMIFLFIVIVPPAYVGWYAVLLYRSPARTVLRTVQFLIAVMLILAVVIGVFIMFDKLGIHRRDICFYDQWMGEYVGDGCDSWGH